MARWKLNEPHYLNVVLPDGESACEWEYIQTDRMTGREVRKRYPVPQYFHHEDETAWTEYDLDRQGRRVAGFVVVSDGHNAQPKDIIFKGPPTPGMICIDDEAKEISAKYSDVWAAPDRMYSPEEGTYAQRSMDKFVETQGRVNMQLADAAAKPIAGMDQYMAALTKIMEQQQTMMMQMIATSSGVKPVVDDLEPLAGVEEPVVEEAATPPPVTAPPPPHRARRL